MDGLDGSAVLGEIFSRLDSWPLAAVSRLLLAACLGALVGVERESHGRSAGFRTHILTAVGAALAMTVSLHFARIYGDSASTTALRIDPARVAYGVMVGIGFLGAGAIMRQGAGIRGLTTAASLWCTAALGLACGFGMYFVAIFSAGLIVFSLLVLSKFDELIPSRRYRTLRLRLPLGQADSLPRLRELLAEQKAVVREVKVARNMEEKTETLTLHLRVSSRNGDIDLDRIAEHVSHILHISIS